MVDETKSPPITAPSITRCPPGTAKGSRLHQWQFGVGDRYGPAEIGTARRLAEGDLKPCETAVLEVVLGRTHEIPQRELEALLYKQIGATRSQVYAAAQRLSKHGKLSRKKLGRTLALCQAGFQMVAASSLILRSWKMPSLASVVSDTYRGAAL